MISIPCIGRTYHCWCSLTYRFQFDDISKQLRLGSSSNKALWARSTKNSDKSTGPLTCPFAGWLAPLTHSLAPPCSLYLRIPLRSLFRLLRSLPHSWESKLSDGYFLCFFLFWTLAHGLGQRWPISHTILLIAHCLSHYSFEELRRGHGIDRRASASTQPAE